MNDLRLGDCLDLLPLLPSESVDAIVTDPPYFQPATHYCPTRDQGTPKKSIGDMSILEHFFRVFITECARIIKKTGSFYIFCDGQSYPIAFTGLYRHVKYVRPLIWDKVISFNGYTWRHQHELIAWGELEGSPRIPTADGDIIKCRAIPVGDRLHPAEKPVDLLQVLVEKTAEGGTVLDPFCGAGSTGVACQRTGRNFIGIEIDPTYYEITKDRLAGNGDYCRSPSDAPLFAGVDDLGAMRMTNHEMNTGESPRPC